MTWAGGKNDNSLTWVHSTVLNYTQCFSYVLKHSEVSDFLTQFFLKGTMK
jgi:hypothetical protein